MAVSKDGLMKVYSEDGKYVVETPKGEKLRINHINVDQNVDGAQRGLAHVTIDFIAQLKD